MAIREESLGHLRGHGLKPVPQSGGLVVLWFGPPLRYITIAGKLMRMAQPTCSTKLMASDPSFYRGLTHRVPALEVCIASRHSLAASK